MPRENDGPYVKIGLTFTGIALVLAQIPKEGAAAGRVPALGWCLFALGALLIWLPEIVYRYRRRSRLPRTQLDDALEYGEGIGCLIPALGFLAFSGAAYCLSH